MAGQFLDILYAARGWDELDDAGRVALARRVVRYKSAKYSVEQPLLIGADAAGVDAADQARLSAYGLALGEAFQLRDDVLGVYGDPVQTGCAGRRRRPARGQAHGAHRARAGALLRAERADPHRGARAPDLSQGDIDEMRAIITDCGALDELEEMITAGTRAAPGGAGAGRRLVAGGPRGARGAHAPHDDTHDLIAPPESGPPAGPQQVRTPQKAVSIARRRISVL